MNVKKISALLLSVGLVTTLTACEQESEKDMIADAQFCLDEARTGAQAQACMSKISGLNSKQANTLRCATGFISAEITQPANLAQALNSMSEDGASTSTVLSILAFKQRGGLYGADKTFEYCRDSQSAGLSLLSAMSKTATVISEVAGLYSGGGTIEQHLETAMDDLLAAFADSSDLDAQEAAVEKVVAIGTSIITVYQASCGGTSTALADICKSIDEAVPQGYNLMDYNADKVGELLLEYWKQSN